MEKVAWGAFFPYNTPSLFFGDTLSDTSRDTLGLAFEDAQTKPSHRLPHKRLLFGPGLEYNFLPILSAQTP